MTIVQRLFICWVSLSSDTCSCLDLVQDKAIAEEQVRLVRRQQERIQKLKKVICYTYVSLPNAWGRVTTCHKNKFGSNVSKLSN